jgi:hypothetical protein
VLLTLADSSAVHVADAEASGRPLDKQSGGDGTAVPSPGRSRSMNHPVDVLAAADTGNTRDDPKRGSNGRQIAVSTGTVFLYGRAGLI